MDFRDEASRRAAELEHARKRVELFRGKLESHRRITVEQKPPDWEETDRLLERRLAVSESELKRLETS